MVYRPYQLGLTLKYNKYTVGWQGWEGVPTKTAG